MAEDAKPHRPWWRRADLLSLGALLVLVVWVAPLAWRGLANAADVRPPGEVLFTGLDDSAQSMLARSLEAGAPLVCRDDAFAAVPPDVRPALLYRPGLPRKTRDLAHQLDPATCTARPFFQPFLPWQRAHQPWLPLVLAFAAFFILAFASLPASGHRRLGLFAMFQLIGLAVAAIALVPWIPRFAFGPFAEGPATILAAFALALAAVAPGTAPWGAAEGLCLGLAATFHPTLALFAVPIALFAVLRRGAWRHTAALALGATAGLAPLVWSTLRVTAPYGNFLDPAALRRMVAGSPDIRALAVALAASLPFGIAGLALAHRTRLRAAMSRPRARTAVAVASGAAIALAVAAALLHPAARRALSHDLDGIVLALPPIAAALAMGLRSRRPATCALLAGCAIASLPFFVIQGQEVHVGIWSLRRSLPPFALLALAAAFAAFEPAPEETEGPDLREGVFPRRAGLRRLWVLLAFLCAFANLVRLNGALFGGETGADKLVLEVESRMNANPGALYLFDYFSQGAPFVSRPGRDAFGLNDATAKTLGHGRVAAWLRDECAKRPVYVVSCTGVSRPVLDDGIALVPEGDPVFGTVLRVDGKTFGTARTVASNVGAFDFLRVRPAEPGDATTILPGHAPFGLAPGAWDEPRRGRDGRWACDGAAFWGPVPKPGETLEVSLDALWWTRDGTNAPPQRLRLETPFPGESAEAVLEPLEDWSEVVLRAGRDPADAEPRPATGLYRIRAAERYDEKGFPPALAARVRAIRAAVR